MTTVLVILVIVISIFILKKIFGAPREPSLHAKIYATTNAIAKLKTNVDMFRAGISPEKLSRTSDKTNLEYYVGYIASLARTIAEADSINPDGVIMALVQTEASRLFGNSADENGSYAEGIDLLPQILSTDGALLGLHDGNIDGRYVVNPSNSGPYFEKLRRRFGVRLPTDNN